MEHSFKDSILELLSATGYALNLKKNQLSSLEVHEDLKPFFDWFNLNISKDNCITSEELENFKELQKTGEILCSEKLDEALQAYYDHAVDFLPPNAESFNETIADEVTCIKDQLGLKSKLIAVLRSSISVLSGDVDETRNYLRRAENQQTEVVKNLLSINKVFNSKLAEVRQDLNELRENLSDMAQVDVSTDEGIDSLSSEKLTSSTWSLASSVSILSNGSDKAPSEPNCKYLSQLSLVKYGKHHQRFYKLVDNLMQKLLTPKPEIVGDIDFELDLELLNITNRLFQQKVSLMRNLAKLEGIKDGLRKIKEIQHDMEKHSWKVTVSKLRKQLMDLEDNTDDLEESFVKESDNLSELCETWAELQIYVPICDTLQERIRCSTVTLAKLGEVMSAVKKKLMTDTAFCSLLEFEGQQVNAVVDLCYSVETMVRQWVEGCKRRMEAVSDNLQDYNNYCTLPVEDRSELIEKLATALNCDRKRVGEAVSSLTETSERQHEHWAQQTNHQIQTIISVEHEMKEFYNKEIRHDSKRQVSDHRHRFLNIQAALDELSNMIMDSALYSRHLLESEGNKEENNRGLQELMNICLIPTEEEET